MKRKFAIILCAILSMILCFCLVACGDTDSDGGNDNSSPLRDNTKWFSQQELAQKGLDDLPQPSNLTGNLKTSVDWINDGYSFSQSCPSEAEFYSNAQTYFDYFKTNYEGLFGKVRIKMSSSDECWYNIEPSTTLENYFDDNPSKLYKFYYVKDTTVGDDGYLLTGAVLTFEIRYEFDTTSNGYLFKMFVESADKSPNGMITYHYRLKESV